MLHSTHLWPRWLTENKRVSSCDLASLDDFKKPSIERQKKRNEIKNNTKGFRRTRTDLRLSADWTVECKIASAQKLPCSMLTLHADQTWSCRFMPPSSAEETPFVVDDMNPRSLNRLVYLSENPPWVLRRCSWKVPGRGTLHYQLRHVAKYARTVRRPRPSITGLGAPPGAHHTSLCLIQAISCDFHHAR